MAAVVVAAGVIFFETVAGAFFSFTARVVPVGLETSKDFFRAVVVLDTSSSASCSSCSAKSTTRLLIPENFLTASLAAGGAVVEPDCLVVSKGVFFKDLMVVVAVGVVVVVVMVGLGAAGDGTGSSTALVSVEISFFSGSEVMGTSLFGTYMEKMILGSEKMNKKG